MRRLGIGLVVVVCAWMGTPAAHAREDGITNRSTSGCDSCHSGGTTPAVSITGPTSLDVGQTASYTLTVTGGAGVVCGLDVSATLGALAAVEMGTRLESGEIVHDLPRAFAAGSCSFDFDWTAPDVAGSPTASLQGAGNSANGDGGTAGDLGATTVLNVAVTGGATATISANPNLVSVGSSTTLTWTTANATDCDAFGAWTGTKSAGTDVTEIVMPAEGSNVYGLDCFGSVGTATATTSTTVTGVANFPSFPIQTVDLGNAVGADWITVGGDGTLFVNAVIPIGGVINSAVGNIIPTTERIFRSVAPDGTLSDLSGMTSSFPIFATANNDLYFMYTTLVGISTHSHIGVIPPGGTSSRVTTTLVAELLQPFSAGNYIVQDDGTIYWVVLSYAAATHPGRSILRVDPDGSAQVVLAEPDGLSSPVDVAVDAAGGVYAAESFFDRFVYGDPAGGSSILIDSTGDGNEPLDRPSAAIVDSFGNAYVAGEFSDNVFRVTPQGVVSVAISKTQVGVGVFNGPVDLEADAHGNVYVIAENSKTAWVIRPDGTREFLIDSSGDGVTAMGTPLDIAVGDDGKVYVSDSDVIFQITVPIPEPRALLQSLAAIAALLGLRRRKPRSPSS